MRASNDRLYAFAAQPYVTTIRAFWTPNAGLPSTAADFGGSSSVDAPAVPISLSAAYDGGTFVHLLVNLENGELRDFPFDIGSGTFSASTVLATGGGTVAGDYIGSSGASAMFDNAGALHVSYWTAANQIIYASYLANGGTGQLAPLSGPTRIDIAGAANHPSLAVSPLDQSVTVAWVSQSTAPPTILARTRTNGSWNAIETASTAPVWTSSNAGINIDQGPSLLITGDGHRHLAYIEDYQASGAIDYGRTHYATTAGSGWTDTATTFWTHDPALAADGAGTLYLFGHGHPLDVSPCTSTDNLCTLTSTATGWAPPQLFAKASSNDSFDASPSVKWSAVGWNRPESVEVLFFSTPYTTPTLWYGRLAGASSGPTTPTTPSASGVQLTVSKLGTGSGTVSSTPSGIACGSTCSATYPTGTIVSLTATPAADSTFAGWGGDTACAGGVVTMDVAHSCTATFTKLPTATLSIVKNGTGNGTVSSTPSGISCGSSCKAAFPIGTVVTLKATAAKGSAFSGWSSTCTNGTVTLTTDTSCTATFSSVRRKSR